MDKQYWNYIQLISWRKSFVDAVGKILITVTAFVNFTSRLTLFAVSVFQSADEMKNNKQTTRTLSLINDSSQIKLVFSLKKAAY